MPHSGLMRVVAILLLLIAAGTVYACDISDACLLGISQGTDCDQPSGDNCLCCCQHVVPQPAIPVLEPGDRIDLEPAPMRPGRTLSRSSHIDHPPQL